MNENLSVLGVIDPARLTWPAALPLEIALGVPLDSIRASYSISEEEWEVLCGIDMFRKAVLAQQSKLGEEGYSYKAKAKLQAESLLHTAWELIHAVDTPATVKADLIKFTARLAGYDSQKGPLADSGTGFTININMGTTTPTNLIDIYPDEQ